MIQKKILLFFFILLCFISNAQAPIYHKIGEKEFANTDIYTVFFDETSELIYAGTNNGLFVYKENVFTKLKGPSTQIGNSFFDLKKDKNGNVFCNNLNGQVFKINEQDNTYELFYAFNGEDKNGSMWFFFTSANNLLVANKTSIHIISPQGIEIDKRLSFKKIKNPTFSSFNQTGEGSIFFELGSTDIQGHKTAVFQYGNSTFKHLNANQENNAYSRSSFFFKNNGSIISIGLNGHLKHDTTIFENYTPQRKERFYAINDSVFIALNAQKGYRYFNLKNDTLTASQTIFPNLFISAFYQTKNNKQLLGTFGDGIIIIPSPKKMKYEHDYLFLDIATSPKNNVAISTRSGDVFNLDKNKLIPIDKHSSNIDNIFYVGDHKEARKLGYSDFFYTDFEKKKVNIKDLKIINDNAIIISTHSSIQILIDDKEIIASNLNYLKNSFTRKIILNKSRYGALEWISKDSLLFYCTNLGVYSKGWSSNIKTPILYKNKLFTANDLVMYDNQLVCATDKKGILVYNNTTFQYEINKSDGLYSNNVKQLICRNDKLYILTEKGLQLYDLGENKFLTIKNESHFENVTDMAMSDDRLWLIEKHSYFSVLLNNLIKTKNEHTELKLFINRIEVNNQPIDIKKDISFDYTQNRFEFTYDYRNIFNKNKTEILYTLEGTNSDWETTSTKTNSIVFQSLAPGKYVFKIKATNKNSSSKIFSYEFTIRSPFWTEWWFYTLILLFIIIGVVLYFKSRLKRIKQKNLVNLERQKLLANSIDSELKAIRSQMNPHFIFNAINSIQDLVLQKNTLQSYDSLVLFSKLVRNTLDYSEQEYILLSEEMDYLTIYLELEKLRFSANFEFKIENTISGNLMIPSMVIQPFVENAIKHGLLHKSGNKQLIINFSTKNKQLICSVKDNGVGRDRAREISERQQYHKSFSTKAIQKRLSVLEQKTGDRYYYKTNDLTSENGDVLGTEIKVFLPILSKENTVRKENPTGG